jgi:hypothetical protein
MPPAHRDASVRHNECVQAHLTSGVGTTKRKKRVPAQLQAVRPEPPLRASCWPRCRQDNTLGVWLEQAGSPKVTLSEYHT